jgi:prepilin-type N-terminal cleavage/methylation domain-containing protein
MKGEKGFVFIETIVALALLGIVAVFFLSSVGTATKATVVADEQVNAESLARRQIEYLKACDYQYSASEYPLDPMLDIPGRWSITNPTVEALHDTDDGIQKITFTVQHDGEGKFTAVMYKMDR